MKAWIGAVALVGVLGSGGVNATDGNMLLEYCQLTVRAIDSEPVPQNSRTNISIGQCFGMVESARTTVMIYEGEIPKKGRACFPDGVTTNSQLARIVSKYLHDNPAKLNEDATVLIQLAYRDAYPCK